MAIRKLVVLTMMMMFTILFVSSASAAWWNVSFDNCRNVTIDSVGFQRSDNWFVQSDIDTSAWGIKPHNNSIRIVNTSCDNSGGLVPSQVWSIAQNTSGHMTGFTLGFIANLTANVSTNATNYSVYYTSNTSIEGLNYSTDIVYINDSGAKWGNKENLYALTAPDYALDYPQFNNGTDKYYMDDEHSRRWEEHLDFDSGAYDTINDTGTFTMYWNGSLYGSVDIVTDNTPGWHYTYEYYAYQPYFKITIYTGGATNVYEQYVIHGQDQIVDETWVYKGGTKSCSGLCWFEYNELVTEVYNNFTYLGNDYVTWIFNLSKTGGGVESNYSGGTASNVTWWPAGGIVGNPKVFAPYFNSSQITNHTYYWLWTNTSVGEEWKGNYTYWLAEPAIVSLSSLQQNVTGENFTINGIRKIKGNFSEGENATFWTYVTNNSNGNRENVSVQVLFNNSWYNATYMNISGVNMTFETNIAMPTLPEGTDNFTFNVTHMLVVERNGTMSYENFSTNDSVTVNKLQFGNCTGVRVAESLRFDTYDEETWTQLTNITYHAFWQMWSASGNTSDVKNYSTVFNNQNNATFCIHPSNVEYFVNMTLIMNKKAMNSTFDDYEQSTHYLINASMNGTLQVVNTYMITVGNATSCNLLVKDDQHNGVGDAYIKIQRYEYENTSWRTVRVVRTDTQGAANTYLHSNDVAYNFIIQQGTDTVKEYFRQTVPSTNCELVFSNFSSAVPLWNMEYNIMYLCTWNNNTKVLRCTANDPTGLMVTSKLTIKEQKMFGAKEVCSTTVEGDAPTLTCDISTLSNVTQGFNFMFEFKRSGDDSWHLLYASTIDPNVQWNPYGLTGVFVAFMIILLMVTVGMFNPAAAVILAVSGVAISVYSNLLVASEATVVGLVVVAAFVLYKIKV